MCAAEMERARRVAVLAEMEAEEENERQVRRAWAINAIEEERQDRIQAQFLETMASSTWFADTISTFVSDYEVVCPYTHLGCQTTCKRNDLQDHIVSCEYHNHDDVTVNKQNRSADQSGENANAFEPELHELVCPYAVMGCQHTCSRATLSKHLLECEYAGKGSRESEEEERDRWRKLVIVEAEEERARREGELELHKQGEQGEQGIAASSSSDASSAGVKGSNVQGSNSNVKTALLHSLLQNQIPVALASLHEEIRSFASKMTSFSLKLLPARQAALEGICNVVDGLWGESAEALLYGSCATGLDTKASDVDVVVCFTKGGKGGNLSESLSEVLSVAEVSARIALLAGHMSSLPWLRISAVVEHGRVPVIKATALVSATSSTIVSLLSFNDRKEGELDAGDSGDFVEVPLDISIDGPTHSGISSTSFVRMLTTRLPSLRPIVLSLKRLLAVHGLNDPFTGGLSSYGLVLMVVFLMLKQRKLLRREENNVDAVAEAATAGAEKEKSNKQTSGDENSLFGCSSSRSSRDKSYSQSSSNPSEGGGGGGGGGSEGGKHLNKRLLDPELQLSFGVSAAQTILSQAGFRVGNQRTFLDVDNSDDSDDGNNDFDDMALFGFTFYIQRQEHIDDDSEEGASEEEEESTNENEGDEGTEPAGSTRSSMSEQVQLPLQNSPVLARVSSNKADETSSGSVLWGQLLLDFFQFFGDDFDVLKEGFSIRGGGFSFPLHGKPPHPQANDPFVIEDPLNATNNVGRSNYRISQLQAVLTEALLTTKSSIARYDRRKGSRGVAVTAKAGVPGGRVGEGGGEGEGGIGTELERKNSWSMAATISSTDPGSTGLLTRLLSVDDNYEHYEQPALATVKKSDKSACSTRSSSKDANYHHGRSMLTPANQTGGRRKSSVRDDRAWML